MVPSWVTDFVSCSSCQYYCLNLFCMCIISVCLLRWKEIETKFKSWNFYSKMLQPLVQPFTNTLTRTKTWTVGKSHIFPIRASRTFMPQLQAKTFARFLLKWGQIIWWNLKPSLYCIMTSLCHIYFFTISTRFSHQEQFYTSVHGRIKSCRSNQCREKYAII